MQYAILSDIHADFKALKKALFDINERGVNTVFCLGDIVGYGSQPEETIQLIKSNNIISVQGNHDETALDSEMILLKNNDSDERVQVLRNQLSSESLTFLSSLPKSYSYSDFYLVHGLPPPDNRNYIDLLNEDETRALFTKFESRIAFVGHTHLFSISELNTDQEITQLKPFEKYHLTHNSRYIINVGSLSIGRFPGYEKGYVIYDDTELAIEKVLI